MFAIPGIAALIVFIIARPQEAMPLLQRVPFLHLFTALAVLGWIIDVRLRRSHPVSTPVLPWAAVYLLWCLITLVVNAPDQLIAKTIDLSTLFILYATIAHGVQKFRTFQLLAGVVAVTTLFVALICFHQGLAPLGCVGGQEREGEIAGEPDGRECVNNDGCFGPDAEPGLDYRCEHVGMLGTYSVEERVRYRGGLQDPNEVSLAVSAGAVALLVAFLRRKHNPVAQLACVVGIVISLVTIFFTQSRGGQVSALLVFFVYMVRKYRIWAFIPAGLLALPIMLLGGREGENADLSTQLRYEAWATGLSLFKTHPIFGVGMNQFGKHHFLTAHNSFVLALTESGFIGLFLFVSIIYLTFKSLIVGLRQLAAVRGAQAAQVWGMALLSAMAAIVFQIGTLSFNYHPVLWIFFGLVGAWTGAIRHHQPSFNVKLTWRDVTIILVACVAYITVILPIFLKYKGEM